MTAEEALARLANACGDSAVDDTASWEVEALKRAGWSASMVLGQPDGGFTIVMSPPKKVESTRCSVCGCADGMHYGWCQK